MPKPETKSFFNSTGVRVTLVRTGEYSWKPYFDGDPVDWLTVMASATKKGKARAARMEDQPPGSATQQVA